MNYQDAVKEYTEINALAKEHKGKGAMPLFGSYNLTMYDAYVKQRELGLKYIAGYLVRVLQEKYKDAELLELDVPYIEELWLRKDADLLKVVRNWDVRFEMNPSIAENYIDIFGEYQEHLFTSNLTDKLLRLDLTEEGRDIAEQFILSGMELTDDEVKTVEKFVSGISYIGKELERYLLNENKLDLLLQILVNPLDEYSKYYDSYITNKIKHGYFDQNKSVIEQCFNEKQWKAIREIKGRRKEYVFFEMFKGKNKKLTTAVCEILTDKSYDGVDKTRMLEAVEYMCKGNIRKENIDYVLSNSDEVYEFVKRKGEFEMLSQDDVLTKMRIKGLVEFSKELLLNKYGVEYGPKAKRAPYDEKDNVFRIGAGGNRQTVTSESPYFAELVYTMSEGFDNEAYKYNYQQWMHKYLEIRNYSLYKELQNGNEEMLSAAFRYVDQLDELEGTLSERIEKHCITSESGLKYLLNLSDEFIEKNKNRLVMFCVNGGFEIVDTLCIQYGTELRGNLIRIVKAAISDEKIFKQFKYGNLENELQMQLTKEVKKQWQTNNAETKAIELSGQKTEIQIVECDDFMNVINIGVKPQHTCQSWKGGSYNKSLLSNFDGNKKVLYAINASGETIARSIIRLTKLKNPGAVIETNRLSFVDVTEKVVATEGPMQLDLFTEPVREVEKANEELAIFLERTYCPYNERNDIVSCFANYVKNKAAKMDAIALSFAAVNESEQIQKDFYITETQNSIQYLDSFAGATSSYGYQKNITLNKL